MRTAAGAIEFLKPQMPRLPELVDLWGNYLEFWAQNGGMEEAIPEEIDRAHQIVQVRAAEVLREYAPGDPPGNISQAYSNMALAAAKEIRIKAFAAEIGEVRV